MQGLLMALIRPPALSRSTLGACPSLVGMYAQISRDSGTRKMATASPAGLARADRWHSAYMKPDMLIEGAPHGPLAGLSVVVKDSYDVEGHCASNGSPEWQRTHPPAAATAPPVLRLSGAGASIIGKTIMDELAFSLNGNNAHFGTPVNPACPDRLPGGSSSGAAAAVAAGDADIGLGGDTAGSVRVPASYCGVLGFRPTHGAVPTAGSAPLAPSFDTAGWLARDAGVLRRAGDVLLDSSSQRPATLRRWLVAKDAFALADSEAAQAIHAALAGRMEAVQALLGPPQEIEAAAGVEGGLESWREAFRIHQLYEVWQTHGAWIRWTDPQLGPGIKERLDAASTITRQQFEDAATARAAARRHLEALLGGDAVLALPSAPGPAPLLGSSTGYLEQFRLRLLQLTCVAGLSGFPQVSLPIATVNGCPVGLGLMGPPGSDKALLQLAEQLMAALGGKGAEG